MTVDYYGRRVPKHAHGTQNLGRWTASARIITEAVMELYSRITDEKLLIRRISVTANHVTAEADARKEETYEQLNLFTDYGKLNKQQEEEKEALEKSVSSSRRCWRLRKDTEKTRF